LPGTYTVTVKYGENEASTSVNVLTDPRYNIPESERIAKFEAQLYVGSLQETVTDAIERIRETRTEIDDVLKFARKSQEETTATSTNGRRGTNGGNRDLMRAGNALKKTLTETEKLFWTPPGSTKGIQRQNNVYRQLGYVGGSLESSKDAPTQAQMYYLRHAEAELQQALIEFNRVFAEDVTNFRAQVEAAGIDFFEPKDPLAMPER
jgi:hypothetical protein